jgi:hypothetical protein
MLAQGLVEYGGATSLGATLWQFTGYVQERLFDMTPRQWAAIACVAFVGWLLFGRRRSF